MLGSDGAALSYGRVSDEFRIGEFTAWGDPEVAGSVLAEMADDRPSRTVMWPGFHVGRNCRELHRDDDKPLFVSERSAWLASRA